MNVRVEFSADCFADTSCTIARSIMGVYRSRSVAVGHLSSGKRSTSEKSLGREKTKRYDWL
jgi:hypothetical protein